MSVRILVPEYMSGHLCLFLSKMPNITPGMVLIMGTHRASRPMRLYQIHKQKWRKIWVNVMEMSGKFYVVDIETMIS